jgi:3-phosphoshikimate 1-carboxyvinyltransferase
VVARNVIMNPTRIGFYEKLRDMGVEVEWGRPKNAQQFLGESVADLTIYRHHDSPLKPVCVKPQDVAALIDEIPVLAMTASFADGVSSLAGLAELRVKESDRFAQILQLLEKGGVHVTSGTDWLKVDGQRCRSVNAFSFGSDDHRMVMSAMIFATAARGPSRIAGLSWIRTSFPLFLEAFQNINLDIV